MGRFYRSRERSRIPIAINRLQKLRKLKKLAEAKARRDARLAFVSRIPVAIHRLKKRHNIKSQKSVSRIPVAIHRLKKKPNVKSQKSVTRIPGPVQPIPGAHSRGRWPPKRKTQKAIRKQQSDRSAISTASAPHISAKPGETHRRFEKTASVDKQADAGSRAEPRPQRSFASGTSISRQDKPSRQQTPRSSRTGARTEGRYQPQSRRNITDDEHAKGEYLRLRKQILAEAERYLDHILTESDKFRDDMEAKGRQLRQEQDLCKKARQQAKLFQTKFEDEKMQWTTGQEKVHLLMAKKVEFEIVRQEKAQMDAKLAQLQKEIQGHLEVLSFNVDENKALKKRIADIHGSVMERDRRPEFELKKNRHLEAPRLPRILPEMPSVSRSQSRLQGHVSPFGILPNPPPSCTPRPPSGTGRSRRPYTGKSRKEQTLKLPPITENQKVIKHPQSPKDDRNDNSSMTPGRSGDRYSGPRSPVRAP